MASKKGTRSYSFKEVRDKLSFKNRIASAFSENEIYFYLGFFLGLGILGGVIVFYSGLSAIFHFFKSQVSLFTGLLVSTLIFLFCVLWIWSLLAKKKWLVIGFFTGSFMSLLFIIMMLIAI